MTSCFQSVCDSVFVIHTRYIDNIPEEKVQKDTDIDSVAFEDLEGRPVTKRFLSSVIHNSTDIL